MAHDNFVTLITALNHATSPSTIADILHQIKHSLIGHVQRKESAVKAGLILPLLRITTGHQAHASNGINGASTSASDTVEDNRVHATVILASLAAAGPRFLAPLLASEAVPCLLINASNSDHPALVLASLQTLRHLSSIWAQQLQDDSSDDSIRLGIFTPESSALFNDLLLHGSSGQRLLVCKIIAYAAKEDNSKSCLAFSDVVDTLASLLVAHTVNNTYLKYQGDVSQLPLSPELGQVPEIIAAIGAIVSGSVYRTQCFVHSPSVRELCASISNIEEDTKHIFTTKSHTANSTATLLPLLQVPHVVKHVDYNGAIVWPPEPYNDGISEANHANAVVSWLLYYARKLTGIHRLATLRLIALVELAISGAADATAHTPNLQRLRAREKQLAYLAVPLAVRLVQDTQELDQSPESTPIREQACEVLAMLIDHNKVLQETGDSAGAIKLVCSALRKSFEAVTLSKSAWSPAAPFENANSSPSEILGNVGMPAEVVHVMRCRYGALKALAALADKEEAHRKAIVEANVTSLIAESLKPLSTDFATTPLRSKQPIHGNTSNVILAACQAAQTLSRSVNLLRTNLIDAGVAKPIFELLKHPRLEIQVAATDVCANFVLDFSPMREDLLKLGVTKTLCDHTKAGAPSLRLSSLWTLKHLVLNAPMDLRVKILDELGADWLVDVASGDQNEIFGTTHGGGVALSRMNAAGERVDLLNPANMDIDDLNTDMREGEDDTNDHGEEDGELLYDEASKTHYQHSSMRSTLHNQDTAEYSRRYLTEIRNAEQNAAYQARRHSLNMQEQALDFMRNLFSGSDCISMLNCMFQQVGQQRLLDMLLAKLSPIPVRHHRATQSSTRAPIYNPGEIILATVSLLNHIANGNAVHKEAVVSHRSLLEALQPHFSHPNPRVRTMIVWLVSSLVWIEEQCDKVSARQRANVLRQVGIEASTKRLASDQDMDVRERVKVAIRHFDVL